MIFTLVSRDSQGNLLVLSSNWPPLAVTVVCTIDSFLVVWASVETCGGIFVVPTLAVFPDCLVGASVLGVSLVCHAPGVCIVVAFWDANELPLFLAIAVWVVALGRAEVAATAGVTLFTTVVAESGMVVEGAAGFVTVDNCVWVGLGVIVGLGVAVTVGAGVVMAVVGFADIGAGVDWLSFPAGVPVVPPVSGFLLTVGLVADVLPPAGTGVVELFFFDTVAS